MSRLKFLLSSFTSLAFMEPLAALHFRRPLYAGPARRTREPLRYNGSDHRKELFQCLQNLGSCRGFARTESPWKRFDKALDAVAKNEGWRNDRWVGFTLDLPALPRNIQRKVLKRTERYFRVQVRFGQKHWQRSR